LKATIQVEVARLRGAVEKTKGAATTEEALYLVLQIEETCDLLEQSLGGRTAPQAALVYSEALRLAKGTPK
jgi:hypothetical protein